MRTRVEIDRAITAEPQSVDQILDQLGPQCGCNRQTLAGWLSRKCQVGLIGRRREGSRYLYYSEGGRDGYLERWRRREAELNPPI